MKSVVLTVSGLKFSESFTTFVTKVVNPESDSRIVLDTMRHVEISLGSVSAASLGIEKNSKVTIKPNKTADGSFTLEVGEKEKKKETKQSTRGSSPLPGQKLSNRID